MASTSKEPFSVEVNMILTPVKTSEDDGSTTPEDDDIMQITPIAYFPKGQRMFSGSQDKTTRQWDLQAGKEIEEARDVCEEEVWAAAVSRDGRWVVTGGGDDERSELKACEVETGIVKRFQGHSQRITCIDISADNVLLASGSFDETARIWNLETGKLVAGPFKSDDDAGAVRFSPDSKKLAVKSWTGDWIEVWDVQSQKLDVRVGEYNCPVHAEPAGPVTVYGTFSPVFWTNKNKTIIAAFSFTDDDATTIYEFDASTLKTIGTPFKGHTDLVTAFALLFDGAFLVSASDDFTVKLWAFESRQLIASFDAAGSVQTLISSPDSLQLAHTFYTDPNIYISNATAALLAIPEVQSTLPKSNATLQHLLNSDATRRPAVVRRTPAKRSIIISSTPRRHIHSPTIDPQQHTFLRHVRKLFHFSSRTNVVPPVQHRDPLDFPATSPLPPIRSASSQAATQLDHIEITSPPRRSNGIIQVLRQGISFRRSGSQHEPSVVEVSAGRKFTRLAAAKFPEYRKVNDTRHPSRQQTTGPQDDPSSDSSDVDSLPDVHWFKALLCYFSCWSHGRLRTPPRWRLERVDTPR